ncbi:hypothetical protein BH23CHL8_BH23CHL8_18780 [soil metagenome]
MSRGHGSSRRQTYGRRMKDLRTRRGDQLDVDLEGPNGWTRGEAWDPEQAIPRPRLHIDGAPREARPH